MRVPKPNWRTSALLIGAVVASVALVVLYALLGGGSYEPAAVADPCAERPLPTFPTATDGAVVAQRVVLVALDRTACTLGVSRESLALDLVGPGGVAKIAADAGVSPGEVTTALTSGVKSALVDANTAGVLPGSLSDFLTSAADVVPIDLVVRWATSQTPPCENVPWNDAAGDLSRVTARVGLDGLARTACALDVPVADVVVAVATNGGLASLAQQTGKTEAEVEEAVRASVTAAVDSAEQAGALEPGTADVVRQVVGVVPVDQIIATVRGDRSACDPVPFPAGGTDSEVAARIGVVASLDTACTLKVPIVDVVTSLVGPNGVATLAQKAGTDTATTETAIRNAVTKAVDDASAAGALMPGTASVLHQIVDVVPVERIIATVQGGQSACDPLAFTAGGDTAHAAAQIGVIAALKAACALNVPVEDLVVSLADPAGVAGLAQRAGTDPATVEAKVRDAVHQAIAQAQDAGAISSVVARALDDVVDVVPIDRVLAIVRGDDSSCFEPTWRPTSSREQTAAQIVLVGLSKAACVLQVPIIDLGSALTSEASLDSFLKARNLSRDTVENALQDGLGDGVDLAGHENALSGVTAYLLGAAVRNAPILTTISLIEQRVL